MTLYLKHYTVLDFIKQKFFYKIFKKITKKSLTIFMRGGDIISVSPQISGSHEDVLTTYLNKLAAEGASDFLIDIGANIGLTSCQNGNNFLKVYCFEPNPLCVNILKTNLAISLSEKKAEIFDFALGDNDGEFDLYVPKHNWGGAFVKNNNEYSEDVLGKKDGFENINEDNYFIKTVKVKNSEICFANLFSSLISNNLMNGVIKIDVEGYEKKVLMAIAKTLPSSIKLSIIFENWSPDLDLDEIQNFFKDRLVSRFKFKRSIKDSKRSKLRKYLEFLFFGEKTTLVKSECNEVVIGDIIFRID
tara:strand:+ start:460 stop:1368 length:909 start_codon:yes stop_codon:yes gene_type:complete